MARDREMRRITYQPLTRLSQPHNPMRQITRSRNLRIQACERNFFKSLEQKHQKIEATMQESTCEPKIKPESQFKHLLEPINDEDSESEKYEFLSSTTENLLKEEPSNTGTQILKKGDNMV
eukprot:884958_1